MLLLFICCQALCSLEARVYTKISEDWQAKPAEYCARGVSFVSSPVLNAVPPAILYLHEENDAAKHGMAGFIGNCITVLPLKYLTNRKRPDDEHGRWDSSFPSGHTTFAFTQAVVYSHHCSKLKFPLYLYASAVAFSRVYLGKHYPTDVIGGAALGLLTGFLTVKLLE